MLKILISKFYFPIISIILSLTMISCGHSGPVTVTSPGRNITAVIATDGGANQSALTYSITLGDTPVVTDSNLGVILNDIGVISENLKITDIETSNVYTEYAAPFGKSFEVVNKYNETTISLEDGADHKLELIFRVFDDGAAFRYRFPEQKNLKNIEITGELSSFNFAGDHPYWGLHLRNYTTSYETNYTAAALSNITHDSLTALPLLVQVAGDTWVGISEANLTDYAGMYLRGDDSPGFNLTASLSPLPDESGICVKTETPNVTPWRVLMIGNDPGRLVESNIILNLNEPCEFDYSWIRPGKSAWDWWNASNVKGEDFEGAMDNRTIKHYIDFAGDYDLEYMLIDAGWYPRFRNVGDHLADGDISVSISEIDIPELVAYGQERGVGIILWLNWTPVARDMDKAFAQYEKWGIKGIKIDYMDRDDQEMVNFYHNVVKKAAEHKLLVDFHGAYKPTGIRRTYPNLITREGVMGLEYVKFNNRITPEHDCIIPFTRMLAGPIDYTPGGFNNSIEGEFRPRNKEAMTQGTRAHQLALFVIFESPLQVLADYPANYRNSPGIEFLREVPATWDETRVINAQVGDFTTFARKNGDEWYLGSITDWTARELTVPLDFLGAGDYVAEIYADGDDADKNAESVSISEVLVNAGTNLKIQMGSGGGFALRLYPALSGTDLPRYRQ
ncbi:glycoside hydrolase family 97 protein [Candidatus Latescibacterota bacterium]